MLLLKIVAMFGIMIFVIACGKLDSLLRDGDDPPIIDRVVALRNQISPHDTTTVRAEARDPQGEALSYEWSATGGTLYSTTGRLVLWEAPLNPGNYSVRVKVRNGKDKHAEASVTIGVIASEAPTVKIVRPLNGEYLAGIGTTLVEAVASHPNGVRDVQFWAGNQFLGTDNAPPYQQAWRVEGLTGRKPVVARAYRIGAGSAPGVDSINVYIEGVTPF